MRLWQFSLSVGSFSLVGIRLVLLIKISSLNPYPHQGVFYGYQQWGIELFFYKVTWKHIDENNEWPGTFV